MADYTESTNMDLPIPTVSTAPGPEYAQLLNQCLTQIDQHDHTSGSGVPINPSGININADLPFNDNNATELRSVRFQTQVNPLGQGTDIGCAYVSGADFYYNDTSGNQIRLTQAGSPAGAPGSITGLVPPANVTYTSPNQTFTFQSSTATPANLDAGSVTIRRVTANGPGVILSANGATTASFTMTLPSTLPPSSAYLTLSAAGNVGYATPSVNMTNWAVFSMPIHADTDPTTGTVVTNRSLWRRVGDTMQVRTDYYQNGGSGGAGSGIYIWGPLPSGLQIDTTKMSVGNQNGLTGNCGSANVQIGNNSGVGFVTPRSSTGFSILFYNAALVPAGHIFADNTNTPLTATSAAFSFLATVPILGWSA